MKCEDFKGGKRGFQKKSQKPWVSPWVTPFEGNEKPRIQAGYVKKNEYKNGHRKSRSRRHGHPAFRPLRFPSRLGVRARG